MGLLRAALSWLEPWLQRLAVDVAPGASQRREAMYLIAAALVSVAVVALTAFLRLAGSPKELRTLRFLAVLLPSTFIFCIMVALYFLEVDDAVSEVGEHIFATAIMSAGAIPFSVYIFRAFARYRDELAKRAQHLQSLHETSMSVAAESSPPRLERRIVAGLRGIVVADRAALLLQTEGSDHDVLSTDPLGEVLTTWEYDQMASVMKTGGSMTASSRGVAFLGVPVKHHGRVMGAMAAVRSGSARFTTEDELLLEMFAVAVSAALENARRLEEAQLVATVEERERIARDLHDDLGQLLGFLTTKIQASQELVASGRSSEAGRELAGLETATRTLGAQVREAILGLRARVGPDRPLGRALEDYVAEFGIQAGLSTEFVAPPDAGTGLPGSTQYQLLRIAQEALSNARRHAKAKHVVVRLTETDGRIEMTISDDGEGFEPGGPGSGFGLRTMQERVQTLRGSFEIHSVPGVGTDVMVRAPAGRN